MLILEPRISGFDAGDLAGVMVAVGDGCGSSNKFLLERRNPAA